MSLFMFFHLPPPQCVSPVLEHCPRRGRLGLYRPRTFHLTRRRILFDSTSSQKKRIIGNFHLSQVCIGQLSITEASLLVLACIYNRIQSGSATKNCDGADW